MIAIGYNELGEELKDTTPCPKCGKDCEVKHGDLVLPDGTKEPSDSLAYVKCCDKIYLVGINGQSINKTKEPSDANI